MAELLDDAEFWLPSEFLTDDGGIMKKASLKNGNGGNNGTESLLFGHGFTTEFPYMFDSFSVLGSPVGSFVESTETESSDEDEFLAGLTRRLAYSTSQKLTVHALDKNEVPSPPTSPFCVQNDAWDLIYAAAGQVASLKLSNEVPKYTNFNHGGSLSKPQTNQFNGKTSNWQAPVQYQQHQQIHNKTKSNVVGGRPLGLPQSSWSPLRVHSQQKHPPTHPGSGMRAMFLTGSGGVKRDSAGTGVFIPRRYDTSTTNNTNPEPRKKPGCPTVLLPAKVVQALNLNFDEPNNTNVLPQFSPGFASNYDALVARRNALLTQARRNFRQEGSFNLPQEWTY
ncbi:uncharacterized protein LOC120176492 isoform X2 [Hibiscus syriacus]|uniref:uncharacterized protein LOC120176492 isoform X2 n=1 Tax=Hibiscus syriacus TaxID=106335 RepID=UPI001920B637|nr:uncharacterized protein LOC120176492 isoform X2 [Hibiscus syriacus]